MVPHGAQGDYVGHVDGADVPQDDGSHAQEPGEPCVDQGDVYFVISGSKQVPSVAKGVRCQGYDELTLYRQQGEEVGDVVGQGYRDQGVDEGAGYVGHGQVVSGG